MRQARPASCAAASPWGYGCRIGTAMPLARSRGFAGTTGECGAAISRDRSTAPAQFCLVRNLKMIR